ncbi:MAG: MarR family transcriptional regulator [Actinomycetota bacterium]|nr:MarR family transcriptional regulator [Actinomycetota bacterium]MEC9424687.1 MarR family transcriptional regulator [Actinomycetota bacterium]MED6328450.1 MarR family transcriptional regulator [Actinomycetota bacterium]MEE3354508.1 MarR family transcriptional regulator [Actinomycetota bacterium]
MTEDERGDRFLAQATERVAEAIDADLDLFHLSFVLTRVANRFARHVESAVHRPRGLSMAGFRVLFTLWVCGPLEPHRIAVLAGLSRASVSSVVNTLERDGYVERARQRGDRRLVTVTLIARGRRLVREAYVAQHAVERAQYADLTVAEQKVLTDLLGRLLDTPLD